MAVIVINHRRQLGALRCPDKDELHSVRSSLIRGDIRCVQASIAYGQWRRLGYADPSLRATSMTGTLTPARQVDDGRHGA